MNNLKDVRINGLKELRENSLKGLKISGIKNLIFKTGDTITEDISDAELADLANKREEIKKEIKKLNQEKKGIENRIHLIHKTEKEKSEEITEFPWREEIFPPLPRKTHIKMPETFEVKDNSLHAENSGFSEVKDGGMKIKVNGTCEEPGTTPEKKSSEDMTSTTIQAMTVNNAEGDLNNETGKKDVKETYLEKEEKTKPVYPFSAGKINENRISNTNSSNDSTEKRKTESKNNPAAALFGDNLIEELLSSDDLNPEEEQGFMRYLQDPEIGELINDLKNVKSLLARAEHAG